MFGRTHYFNTGHTADYAYFLFQQLLLLLVRYFSQTTGEQQYWVLEHRFIPFRVWGCMLFFLTFFGLFILYFFGRNKASRRTKKN